jgi:putative transposase
VLRRPVESAQYTSIAFGNRCKQMNVRPSMGTVGDAYDNAMAESFFATLECELIARRKWDTKTKARLEIFTWIETWYNPHRRHSGLGQMSPINFEKLQQGKKQTPDISPISAPQLSTPLLTEKLIINAEPEITGV